MTASTSTSGATLYTGQTNPPTTQSATFSAAASGTWYAQAKKAGMTDSAIASAAYTISAGGGGGTSGPGLLASDWVYSSGTAGCVNGPTTSCEYKACKDDPLPSTVYYFCDCQTGASPGCVAGSDAGAGTAASPWQTASKLVTTFNGLAAGGAVALCRGGKWPNQGQLQLTNKNGTASSPTKVRDYAAPWNTGSEPRPNIVANWQFWNGVQNVVLENIKTTESGSWNGSKNIKLCNVELADGSNGSNLGGGNSCATQPCNDGWTWEGVRFLNEAFGALVSGSNMTFKNSWFYNLGDGTALDHALYLGGDGTYNYGAGAQMNYLVQGCEFHQQPGTAGAILVVHGVHDGFQVLDNVFLDDYGKPGDGGWNIALDPGYGGQGLGEVAKNVLIARNVVAGGSNALVHITSCQNCTIENNLIVGDQVARALDLQSTEYCTQPTDCLPSTDFIVRNNTVYMPTSGSTGVTWGYQGTITLENNAIQSAGACYNKASGSGSVTASDYNLFYGCSDTPAGAHSSKTSPQWVSATGSSATWDFRPATGSPLIGAGDATQNPGIDITGGARPALPSIGAYEPATQVTWSTGYWAPDWMAASAINFNAYTHIVHVQLWPKADGTLTELYPGTSAALLAAAHAAGRKVLLGIGGSVSGAAFNTVAGSSTLRTTLAANTVSYMSASYGGQSYDGIDLDYESPDSSGTSVANFGALVAAFKSALPAGKLLAMPGGPWFASWLAPVASSLDQINAMSYYTAPANLATYMAPLLSAGVPRSKLGIGFGLDATDVGSDGITGAVPETDTTLAACQAKMQFTINSGYGGAMVWGMGKSPYCETVIQPFVPAS